MFLRDCWIHMLMQRKQGDNNSFKYRKGIGPF